MSSGPDFSLDRDVFSLDRGVPAVVDEAEDRPYIDALASNPAWQALEERIAGDASAMIQKLLAMKLQPASKDRPEQSLSAFAAEVILLIGEIRGVLRVLEEPVVIRRAIDARRDR